MRETIPQNRLDKPKISRALHAAKSDSGISRIGCSCPGCLRHVARFEQFNAQLAKKCDELRGENESLRHALAQKERAA